MLRVEPSEQLIFNEGVRCAFLTITNVDPKAVTFRVQSTVHCKFRMSPRHGTLAPRASTKIKVELLPDQSISHLGRDRIQVMCIPAPSTQIDKHATQDFWRHNSCYNWYIENHKLCCYQLRPGESPPPIPPSKLRQSLLHFGSETTSATGSANRATGATRVMGKRWR